MTKGSIAGVLRLGTSLAVQLQLTSQIGSKSPYMKHTNEMKLKGLKFDKTGSGELRSPSDGGDSNQEGVVGSDGSSISTSDDDHQDVPEGVTFQLPTTPKGHVKNAKSTDTTKTGVSMADTVATAETKGTTGTVSSMHTEPDEGVEMSQEDLLNHRAFHCLLFFCG